MKVLLPLALIVSILLVYALWGRDWLKKQTFAQKFFAAVEPVEIFLFKKSPTILFARTLQALGGITALLTWVGEIPIEPIMPLFPDRYEGTVRAFFGILPLILNGLGAIVEWLRNRTTLPIEIVSVPEKNMPIEVAAAIGDAAFAKTVAVETVKAAS